MDNSDNVSDITDVNDANNDNRNGNARRNRRNNQADAVIEFELDDEDDDGNTMMPVGFSYLTDELQAEVAHEIVKEEMKMRRSRHLIEFTLDTLQSLKQLNLVDDTTRDAMAGHIREAVASAHQ
jgi:hypothetical protein